MAAIWKNVNKKHNTIVIIIYSNLLQRHEKYS